MHCSLNDTMLFCRVVVLCASSEAQLLDTYPSTPAKNLLLGLRNLEDNDKCGFLECSRKLLLDYRRSGQDIRLHLWEMLAGQRTKWTNAYLYRKQLHFHDILVYICKQSVRVDCSILRSQHRALPVKALRIRWYLQYEKARSLMSITRSNKLCHLCTV